MGIRRQLTVASPLTASQISGAILDALAGRDRSASVKAELAREFGASDVLLTDTGTSGLVLALRMYAAPGEIVAMPAYACVDLIAAARRADVRIRFFDVDPHTLSPDVDSLVRVVTEGVSAIVVAHLYGFPADMPAVMTIARDAGVPVIEDAAQHACATINGKPAGSFGDVTVLSFGRGKGTTSGRGGALLSLAHSTREGAPAKLLSEAASSAKDMAVAAASWMLGRPSIYGIPASLPGLHLGETVYHEAGEPLRMSRGAAALLDRTFDEMHAAAATRRANALILQSACEQSRQVRAVRAIHGGESGYLRFPILPRTESPPPANLGIAHGYPRPLSAEPEARDVTISSPEPLHGSAELARKLVTLPTHHLLRSSDLTNLASWIHAS